MSAGGGRMGDYRRAAALLLLLVAVGGCGYHLAGTGANLPTTARTIRIEPFRNRTREKGLEVQLHRALEEEFRRRGQLDVVREPQGDLVLSGTIRRVGSIPVGFGASDEAVQFQGLLQVSVKLVEASSKKVLYQTRLLQETLDFGAVPGVVVTTSPRFQRGTLDGRDLVDLSNIPLGETRRREAIGELLDLLAKDVYVQSMEGF